MWIAILSVGFVCGMLAHMVCRRCFVATSVVGAGMTGQLLLLWDLLFESGGVPEAPLGFIFVGGVVVFPVVLVAGAIVRYLPCSRIRQHTGQGCQVPGATDLADEAGGSGPTVRPFGQRAAGFVGMVSKGVFYLSGYVVCLFLVGGYVFAGPHTWGDAGGLWLWGELALLVGVDFVAKRVSNQWNEITLRWITICAINMASLAFWERYA